MKKLMLIAACACFAAQASTTNELVRATRVSYELLDGNTLPFSTYTNSTTWLTGMLYGDAMTDFSPAREDAVIESPALVFDGTGDLIDTGIRANHIHQTGIFDLEFLMNIATTANQRIAGNNIASAGYGFLVDILSEKVRFVIADGTSGGSGYVLSHAGAPVSVGWNKVRMWSTDGVTGYVQVNDNESVATTYSRTPAVTNNANATVRIGRIGTDTSYFTGSMAYFKIGDTLHYPFTESTGTKSHDVTTNGNHGTATITSSDAEFWGGTQTNSPYAARYGASRVAHFNGGTAAFSGLNTAATDFTVMARLIALSGTGINSHSVFYKNQENRFYARNEGVYVEIGGIIMQASAVYGLGLNELVPIALTRDSVGLAEYYDKGLLRRSATLGTNTLDLTTFQIGASPLATDYLMVDFAVGDRVATSNEISAATSGVYPSDFAVYRSAGGYGDVVPNSNGTNDLALTSVPFVNIPALLDGTDSASTGLGITNPKGLAHNNAGYSLIFGGATNSFATLLTNTTDNITVSTNAAGLIQSLYEVNP